MRSAGLGGARRAVAKEPHPTGVVQISAFGGNTCAVLGDGTVQCWGNNGYGQLGDGTTTLRTTPVTVLSGASTPLSGVVEVAVGGTHACARLNQRRGVVLG